MSAKQFNEMVNFQSGLLGVSETSSDMHDLLDHETPGRACGGSGRAVLLSGKEMDRRIYGGVGRTGYPWCSPVASERMCLRSALGSATGWDFWESNWNKVRNAVNGGR